MTNKLSGKSGSSQPVKAPAGKPMTPSPAASGKPATPAGKNAPPMGAKKPSK